MSIFEYDQEKHMQMERAEHYQLGYEDGIACGLNRGIEQGIEQGIVSSLLFLLEDLGDVPDEVRNRITQVQDKEILYRWMKEVRVSKTVEEFVKKM